MVVVKDDILDHFRQALLNEREYGMLINRRGRIVTLYYIDGAFYIRGKSTVKYGIADDLLREEILTGYITWI